MSAAAALLDRLGRPGQVRLGMARPVAVPRLATGVTGLDTALGGGLPRGQISELAGPRSMGRTGLACTIAASATRAGETIAWVDPADALEPDAAATAGVALARTLWVRPETVADALKAAELLLGAGGFGLVVLDLPGEKPHPSTWPRLARAAERTRAVLLLVTNRRTAGPAAALGLALERRRVQWSEGPGSLVLLEGVEAELSIVRSRLGGCGQSLFVRQAACA